MASDTGFSRRRQTEREHFDSEDGLTGLSQDLVSCAILEVYDGVAVSLKALRFSLEARLGVKLGSRKHEIRRIAEKAAQEIKWPAALDAVDRGRGRCLFSSLSDLPHDDSLFMASEVWQGEWQTLPAMRMFMKPLKRGFAGLYMAVKDNVAHATDMIQEEESTPEDLHRLTFAVKWREIRKAFDFVKGTVKDDGTAFSLGGLRFVVRNVICYAAFLTGECVLNALSSDSWGCVSAESGAVWDPGGKLVKWYYHGEHPIRSATASCSSFLLCEH